MLSTCPLFTEDKTHIKLMLDTLFSAWSHSKAICRDKCSVCNDIQVKDQTIMRRC
jgi:hypothetical protein